MSFSLFPSTSAKTQINKRINKQIRVLTATHHARRHLYIFRKEILAFRTWTTSKNHAFVEFTSWDAALAARRKYPQGWQGDPVFKKEIQLCYERVLKHRDIYLWDGMSEIVPLPLPPHPDAPKPWERNGPGHTFGHPFGFGAGPRRWDEEGEEKPYHRKERTDDYEERGSRSYHRHRDYEDDDKHHRHRRHHHHQYDSSGKTRENSDRSNSLRPKSRSPSSDSKPSSFLLANQGGKLDPALEQAVKDELTMIEEMLKATPIAPRNLGVTTKLRPLKDVLLPHEIRETSSIRDFQDVPAPTLPADADLFGSQDNTHTSQAKSYTSSKTHHRYARREDKGTNEYHNVGRVHAHFRPYPYGYDKSAAKERTRKMGRISSVDTTIPPLQDVSSRPWWPDMDADTVKHPVEIKGPTDEKVERPTRFSSIPTAPPNSPANTAANAATSAMVLSKAIAKVKQPPTAPKFRFKIATAEAGKSANAVVLGKERTKGGGKGPEVAAQDVAVRSGYPTPQPSPCAGTFILPVPGRSSFVRSRAYLLTVDTCRRKTWGGSQEPILRCGPDKGNIAAQRSLLYSVFSKYYTASRIPP